MKRRAAPDDLGPIRFCGAAVARCAGAAPVVLLLLVMAMGCARAPAQPSVSTCPALLPGTSNGLDDYADMLVWQQRTYVADRELPGVNLAHAKLGGRVTTITCNVYEWSAQNGGLRAAPGPWPDGTATGLEVGTPVHRVRGVKTECALGARNSDGDLRVFVAVDFDREGMPALCR